jgi:hypothetical protein
MVPRRGLEPPWGYAPLAPEARYPVGKPAYTSGNQRVNDRWAVTM